jgi:hypothetical protein
LKLYKILVKLVDERITEVADIRTLKTLSWIYMVKKKNIPICEKLKVDNIVEVINTHR